MSDAGTIGAAADEEGAALLAVSASRRRPLMAALLGSIAHRVIRDARCPELVCPPEPHPALRLPVAP